MKDLKEINEDIKSLPEEFKNEVSDWYHTFWELYEHRCVLYIALINASRWSPIRIFKKSKLHFDLSEYEWWFIIQWYINWKQISYHLPEKYWDNVLCQEVNKADERDWHTSQDVLDRLLNPN